MDIRKLQRAIVDGLEDVKAQNIAVLNTEHLSALFERVIIASGTSNRQTKALAASVRDSVRSRGMAVLATEGEDNGEWIIVDCGAAVVHIMQPGIRDYYHLEEIWGGKPVRMKVGEVKTRLVKASEPEPVRKAAARAAAKTAGQPAARPAAKRPATRKSPAKPAGASRPAAGQTPAAKAAPARKTTPRKAAAGTTTARKTTTRKTSRAG
ncbi:MAG: ribosome silencing factor [Rubrivivax sp.]|jgi:ribosome-associated protein|nr:ribosome silencing factor [Betaproteobacteria bacterium]MBP6318292.1 ribosome silencing factor [Rubrivivax sp.]MBK7276732.1 ribosome silencing factor [Betaproteobacteria bacterium]MBK7517040.1 ribosome silencing factor [Betaproteobacteria bacterium]MBK8106733.1 ribosome silencing factor [Betaproteobacteria bacterium]